MKLPILLFGWAVACFCSCANQKKQTAAPFTGADGEVHLICLDPGHFHAALVQKYPNARIDSTVRVYAPQGDEVQSYLSLVESFNTRPENPTSWNEEVYLGDDFLERMLEGKQGNVVLLAGNNQRKIDYIERSVDAGLNVFADKPLVIDSAGFVRLEKVFTKATEKGVSVYDIMTERYDLLNILQRELMRDTTLFGTLVKGTPQQPAISVTSIHSFYKEVAGKPLTRPTWYYDVRRQGEGIVDVTTHLIDLVGWKCFPEEPIDYRKDIEVLSATHYPTRIPLSDFTRSTGCTQFPDFLAGVVRDSVLEVDANGTIQYALKGVNVAIDVEWRFANPPGSGDISRTVIRGAKATLLILQDKEQNYKPTLYIQPATGVDKNAFEAALTAAMAPLAQKYPGLKTVAEGNRIRIVIPEGSDAGHEAHFASVFSRYTDYLVAGSLPKWETDAMLAKYYITTKAHAMAQQTK